MDESALWGKIPQGKSAVPLWYTTRIFPLWETQCAGGHLGTPAGLKNKNVIEFDLFFGHPVRHLNVYGCHWITLIT